MKFVNQKVRQKIYRPAATTLGGGAVFDCAIRGVMYRKKVWVDQGCVEDWTAV